MDNKINLLIVDDEKDFIELIAKRLEERDFNVIAVNRGDRAVEEARRSAIDIALVDLKMPGMDGEETLMALKNEHPWMEIVILTGHGTVDSAVRTTKAGAYEYLQKPCDIETLVQALTEAYRKRVMNKKEIHEEHMKEFLSSVRGYSPRELLMKLKELDAEEN